MEIADTTAEDSRILIKKHLDDHGIMQKWLADKIGVSRGLIFLMLTQKRGLTEKNRQKINEALKTNF